ncbi:hypothetical protein [Desulfoluna sp.]|uniref:hypothetical protein n=1 Tax=Desulfoluna sp. TaxID=2045199 RepID=UPI00262D43AF|nr:hypothetical protein [Desulfoluna sp.]
MSRPASKATAVVIHYLAYLPLAGVTLSVYLILKTLILQVILLVDKGGWAWVKTHQALNLGFLQLILDDRLSAVRRQLVLGAAKLANTPALIVFPCIALLCWLTGKGLQALAKGIK